jgi:hypothetical protein
MIEANIMETLLTKEILIAAAAIIALLTTVKVAFPKLDKIRVWRRLLPFVPLVLGVASAFLATTEAPGVGDKVLIGLWTGFVATSARKLFTQTVLGKIAEKQG